MDAAVADFDDFDGVADVDVVADVAVFCCCCCCCAPPE